MPCLARKCQKVEISLLLFSEKEDASFSEEKEAKRLLFLVMHRQTCKP
jgi:hypothetical protein